MSSPGEKLLDEGEEFVGIAPGNRNGELKFFCRVSVEDNPDLCVTSNTVKVKVKTCELLFPIHYI